METNSAIGSERIDGPTNEADPSTRGRARLIERTWAEQSNSTLEDAWKNVYRLLLHVDPTTSLVYAGRTEAGEPRTSTDSWALAFHECKGNRPLKLHAVQPLRGA